MAALTDLSDAHSLREEWEMRRAAVLSNAH